MIDASSEEGNKAKGEVGGEMVELPSECTAAHGRRKLTDDEIMANSLIFLVAGTDTSASALSYISYLLALNPDIQEKLQAEIDKYFEDKPVSFTLIC
jgi:cytochrome P450